MTRPITLEDITRFYPLARRDEGVLVGVVLDIAFDYILQDLLASNAFGALGMTFKGGTALRKYYLGHMSRFSFDLDFDAEPGAEDLVADQISHIKSDQFEFAPQMRRGHYSINIASDLLPNESVDAKIDFSTRGLWLPSEWASPIANPLHDLYAFDPPPAPVVIWRKTSRRSCPDGNGYPSFATCMIWPLSLDMCIQNWSPSCGY